MPIESGNNFLKIYARNCRVERVGREEAEAFLNENHYFGWSACRYRYGLRLQRRDPSGLPAGTLVAVGTFSNARQISTGRSCEWVRYASLNGSRVEGGMSKILKAFIAEVQPDDVMTYADASWSDGAVYTKLGFAFEGTKLFPSGASSHKFRLRCKMNSGLS